MSSEVIHLPFSLTLLGHFKRYSDIFSPFPDIVRECPERGHRVRIKLDQGRPHGSPVKFPSSAVKFPSSLVKFPSLHLVGLCQIGHAGPALAKCLDL